MNFSANLDVNLTVNPHINSRPSVSIKMASILLLTILSLTACSNSDETPVAPANGGSGGGNAGGSPGGSNNNSSATITDLDPVYFRGMEKKEVTCPTPQAEACYQDLGVCHIELVFSSDLQQVKVRAIAPHPHDSTPGNTVPLLMGPMTATYNSQRQFYRFRDPAPQAPVKDMVLMAPQQNKPQQYRAEIWHNNHHDPMTCDSVAEITNPQELQETVTLFDQF